MSRTYKDKPYKHCEHWKSWQQDRTQFSEDSWRTIQLPTTRPKRRKEVDTEDHWMTTPSWWNHMVHTKPRRRATKIWEVNVLKAVDLEDVDKPLESNKPHWYFW